MKAIQFKKWAKHQNKNLTEEDIQVTNKHEKMLVNRELQIKSIEILLCTFRMARMRKADKTKDAEQQELSLLAWKQNGPATSKGGLAVSYKGTYLAIASSNCCP